MKKLLHRHVWQRLPYGLRRKVLFTASALVAPRPSSNAQPKGPLLIVGPLRTASGLGQSARLCYEALRRARYNVLGVDLTSTLMQPEDEPSFNFVDGRSCQGPGTLIVHVNAPFFPVAMARLRTLVRNKFVVGYWAWELPNVPDEWRQGVPFVHEIWVPSSFVMRAIVPIASGRPVRVIPHPVALREFHAGTALPSGHGTFRVLSIFNMASSFARKNPIATVRAFRAAFGSDQSARLVIKTSNVSTFQQGARALADAIDGCPNITLLDKTMTGEELETLYRQSDVFISLHRSEGFGLASAEAMLFGLPVVATNWSGNLDLLNDETGIPIPYRMVPAEDPQGTYHHPEMMWAEADVNVAAMALRRLRENPTLRARIGTEAARVANQVLSGEVYASKMRSYLGVAGNGGDHVLRGNVAESPLE